MDSREALATLIDVALISENDKARILAMIPSMTDEEVNKLGKALAKKELEVDDTVAQALEQMDDFLNQIPSPS